MKVAVPLAKNVLAPLRITAVASAIDAGIQKKIHGSGTTTLIISNDMVMEMKWLFNAALSFNKLWNTKVLSERT